jgi:hypothetical protein
MKISPHVSLKWKVGFGCMYQLMFLTSRPVKFFKVAPRRSRRDEMIADMETIFGLGLKHIVDCLF